MAFHYATWSGNCPYCGSCNFVRDRPIEGLSAEDGYDLVNSGEYSCNRCGKSAEIIFDKPDRKVPKCSNIDWSAVAQCVYCGSMDTFVERCDAAMCERRHRCKKCRGYFSTSMEEGIRAANRYPWFSLTCKCPRCGSYKTGVKFTEPEKYSRTHNCESCGCLFRTNAVDQRRINGEE